MAQTQHLKLPIDPLGLNETGNVKNDIATFIAGLADIDGAVSLSTSIPGLADPVGSSCWQQFSPISALIKAHPLPLNLKAASDLEAARLLAIAMNQVCANPNCGQMFLDVNNSIAAITPLPLPISMTSICAKIPVIGTSAVPTAGTVAPIQGTSTPTAPAAAPVAPH